MTKFKRSHKRMLFTFIISIIFLNYSIGQSKGTLKEEIYLETDRSTYISGENILFSVYYNSPFNSNIELSNILYIEVYDSRNTYIKSKFKITDNIVRGYLEIPEDILSGNYFIRAYTKFQRNFPTEWFCLNLISIINPNEAFPQEHLSNLKQVESIAHAYSNNRFDIILRLNEETFFDTKKVIITDSSDNLIAEINPFKNGLVIFNWDNSAGEGFIKLINNKSDTVFFSEISKLERSYVNVNAVYSELVLNSINLSFDTRIASRANSFKLLIKSPDFENLDLQKISIDDSGKMDIDHRVFFQNGIYYFIILDENDNIINITTHFILIDKKIDAAVSLNKKHYEKREEASIKINIDHPIHFEHALLKITKRGLNVLDEECLPRYTTFDYYLLNSYLKYKSIYSTEYLDQINASFLLNNNQINSGSFKKQLFFEQADTFEYIPDIREISIAGTIFDKNTGKPVDGIDVFASIVYGNTQLHHYRTDKNGQFIFSLNEAKNEQNLFITVKPFNKDISISIQNDFHEAFYKASDIPLRADTSDIDLFTQLYIQQQTKKIFNKDIKNIYKKTEINALNLSGLEDYEILMNDYVKTGSVLEIFNELVPYVKLVKNKENYKFRLYNEFLKDTYEDPLILIDYMPVFDINEVLKINPQKIEKIDVINQQYVIGSFQFNGIILIKTNTTNFADIEFPENSLYLKYKTNSKQSIPSFPEYKSKELINDHKADFRNVLYFNTFSGELPTEISFYTSDSEGTFDIIFYGITTQGEIINSYNSFIVE